MRIVRRVQVVLAEEQEALAPAVLAEGTTTDHRSVSSSSCSSHTLRLEMAMAVAVAAATTDTMPAVLLVVATLSTNSSSHRHNSTNSNSTIRMIREEAITFTTTRDSILIQITLSREVSMTTRTRLIMDSSRPISSHRLGDIIIRAAHSTTSMISLSMSRRPIRISTSLSMIRPVRGILIPRKGNGNNNNNNNKSSSDTIGIILGLPKSRSMIPALGMVLRGQTTVLRRLSVGSMTCMTKEDRPLVRKDEDLVGTMVHQVV